MATIRLQVRLLGGYAAHLPDGTPLKLPTRKTDAVLVRLACAAGSRVDRAELIRLLWGDREREQGRGSLRQAFAALRRAHGGALDGALSVDAETAAMSTELARIDVAEFLRLAAERTAESDAAAAELFAGPLLAGFEIAERRFGSWLAHTRRSVHSVAAEVLGRRLTSLEETRAGGSDIVPVAEKLLAIDPLHQAAHNALIRYHALRGENGLALERYEAARQALAAVDRPLTPDLERLRRALGIGAAPAIQQPPADTSGRPSLAVVPVRGPDAGDSALAEGLARELSAALARLSWLFVVDAESGLALAPTVASAEAARRLGVRYLLRASVQRDAARLRATATLIDADGARVLWSDRVDGGMDTLFAWQDEASTHIAGTVGPRLEVAELGRLRSGRPESLDAWQCYLLAAARLRAMTAVDAEAAIGLAARALELEPDYGAAAGLSAWCRTIRVPQQWTDDPAGEAAVGLSDARHALAVGADDATALAMGGYAHAFFMRDYEGGLAALDRALSLDENAARSHAFAGWLRLYVGDHAKAEQHFERALALSPIDAFAFRVLAGLAFARLFQRDFEAAAATARRALALQPLFSVAHRPLVAALGMLDRDDEAREAVADFLAVVPGMTVAYALRETRFSAPTDRTLLEEGWRHAGLPS